MSEKYGDYTPLIETLQMELAAEKAARVKAEQELENAESYIETCHVAQWRRIQEETGIHSTETTSLVDEIITKCKRAESAERAAAERRDVLRRYARRTDIVREAGLLDALNHRAGSDYIHKSEMEKWKDRCIHETAFRVEEIQRNAREMQNLESKLDEALGALRKCVEILPLLHPIDRGTNEEWCAIETRRNTIRTEAESVLKGE